MHCTICTICTLEGESAESAKQKNDMAKLTKLANFRQNFVKIAKIVMQIFIEPAKSEEDIFYLFIQNYQKRIKNFVIFHKGRKGNKIARI